jgi:hypothetical protein
MKAGTNSYVKSDAAMKTKTAHLIRCPLVFGNSLMLSPVSAPLSFVPTMIEAASV